MTLDDGMGYDTPQQTRRLSGRLPWPIITAAAAVVAVIGLIIVGLATTRSTVEPTPTPTPATTASSSGPVTVPASRPPAGGRTASPSSGEHDSAERAGAPTEVWGAFEVFMAAWGETNPVQREKGLAATATSDLARGLVETRPENIVVAARTKVQVVGAGPYSAEFRVWFEDVASSVHVIMINDPGSPHGWRAIHIESRGD